MLKRKLPPFPALRAFEAAARHGRFRDAAEELCVTPSAISHQVRTLETYLGRPLFVRGTRQVELTRDGRTYLEDVSPILDSLEASTRMVAGESFSGKLRLKMTEGFSKRWLIPRLGEYLGQYPDVDVSIETGLPPTDFRNGELDLIIHWGDDPVQGVVVDPFMSSARIPVCSADFLERNPDLRRPEDLLGKTLIRDEVSDGWQEWFALIGKQEKCPRGGPVFAHCELTMSAAESGLGVALGFKAMIGKSLAGGELIAPFALESPARTIYSVAYPEHRRDDPVIVSFRDWLFAEVLKETSPDLADEALLPAAQ